MIAVGFLSGGCVRFKNIAYIQDRYEVQDSSTYTIDVAKGGDLILRPGDNVFINIYGINFDQLELFNKESSRYPSNYTDLSLLMQGYNIDDDGFVEMPIMNKIKIGGLTLAQAQDTLQEKIDEYLVGAIVDLRLLSYEITVLGEVKRPGKFFFYKREINIFDALSEAGDLTSFGDARKVILIRNFDGHSETYNFDLTSSSFFSNPNFWLKPNDVIYVKPLRTKVISMNSPTLTLVFSSLTTLLVILTYFKF